MYNQLQLFISMEISKIDENNYLEHPYALKVEWRDNQCHNVHLFKSILNIALRLWGTVKILECQKMHPTLPDIQISRVMDVIDRLKELVQSISG